LGERRLVSVRVAERAAATLIERFSVSAIPVEVEDIALRLGATIVRKPLERTISGLLLREGGAKLIAVNTDHHPRRQRFTIAHEVGHLQLHAGDYIVDSTMRVNRRNKLSSMASDAQEIEANAFAAALLMPPALVKSALERMRDSQLGNPSRVVESLADQFGVSTEAMGYRLINLGLST
jgi:Zn-dependent peptidase ImmA (M78 family)